MPQIHDAEHHTDEVQELVWALIDDYATDEQVHRLEHLLIDDPDARRIYVTCMQMHADLHYMLGDKQRSLPEVIRKAIEAEQKQKKRTPLPIVNLPISAISVQIPDAFA